MKKNTSKFLIGYIPSLQLLSLFLTFQLTLSQYCKTALGQLGYEINTIHTEKMLAGGCVYDERFQNASIYLNSSRCDTVTYWSTLRPICLCSQSKYTKLFGCKDKSFSYINGSCYRYYNNPLPFNDAIKQCSKIQNGHLIDIESESEQILIMSYLLLKGYVHRSIYSSHPPYIGLEINGGNGLSSIRWSTRLLLSNTNWNSSFYSNHHAFNS